jgi:hypothetical protein
MWDLNGTCTADIQALKGGGFSPASGHTTTLTGSFDGDLTQHFDLSSGGSVNLTSAKFPTLYPQWWGALCGTTDDTTALQNSFNALGPQKSLTFACQSTFSSTLYIPSTADGATINGLAYGTSGATFNTLNTSLTVKTGSGLTNGVVILARFLTLNGFTVNANSAATHAIAVASGREGIYRQVYAAHSNGDGIIIDPAQTPTTTTTSQITAGNTTGATVTVTSLNSSLITLGGATCNNALIEAGTARQEVLPYTSSGLTLTQAGGTAAFTHPIGSIIQCDGNNNSMTWFSPTSASSGGNGLSIAAQSDGNNITFYSPQFESNTGKGMLLSGSGLQVYGGHYEGNGSSAIQLGDLTGRTVIASYFTPPGDDENSTNSIVGVCGIRNTIVFRTASEYTPPTSNPAGCSAGGFPYQEFGVGFGQGNNAASSTSLVTIKNGNGTVDVEPPDPNSQYAGGVTFKKADGTLLNRIVPTESTTAALNILGTSTTDVTKGQFSVDCGFSCAGSSDLLMTVNSSNNQSYIQALAAHAAGTLNLNSRGGTVNIGGPVTAASMNYVAAECTGTNTPVSGCIAGSADHAIIIASSVTLTAGTKLTINLTHTLQAGTNTIQCICNGADTGAIPLKSHYSLFNDIGTAYVGGPGASFPEVIWTGNTKWEDMSQ